MTDFNMLIGQERPIRLLCNALRKNRLPQAFLFSGETGIGKNTAAFQTAKTANCRTFLEKRASSAPPEIENGEAVSACGQCRACRKILSGNHPDIHFIRPTGSYIRIDQIRSLSRTLSLKPSEASTRFVIISEAHSMNPEAGNALLKMLEEPPDATVFILTAREAADLLPTIVSRCQHIRFSPIPQDELESFLTRGNKISTDNAMIIGSLARGSIARALDMANEDWIHQRNHVIEQLRQLPVQPISHRLAFAETIAGDKSKLISILEIMKNWFRDLAVFQFDPRRVYNRDLHREMETDSNTMPLASILEKAEAVAHTERMIEGNANVRLAVDALVVRLAA